MAELWMETQSSKLSSHQWDRHAHNIAWNVPKKKLIYTSEFVLIIIYMACPGVWFGAQLLLTNRMQEIGPWIWSASLKAQFVRFSCNNDKHYHYPPSPLSHWSCTAHTLVESAVFIFNEALCSPVAATEVETCNWISANNDRPEHSW